MDVGIIGLERSGRTTVFDAVTRGHASAGAFAAAEPNIGVVKIPDERLDRLSAQLKPRKVSPTEARFLDFPGGLAVRGAGPTPTYMAALSQCDVLAHVVRAFHDESVPHPAASVDPHRDIEAVNLELAFADIAMLQRRSGRMETEVRSLRPGERDAGERELALVRRLREALEAEEPLRAQELSPDERRTIGGYQFLTDKPLLIIVNIDEAEIGRSEEIEAAFAERWGANGVEVAALCGKLERELTELTDEEAAEFRGELGLAEDGLQRMLQLAQRALGLITFFTASEEDVHAWAVRAGSTALEAAGKVHTDIARGFIRAEVIGWDDFVSCGSEAEARKRGVLRTEGKQYVVEDGDQLYVLFNV